jgi:hypothetical protein
MTGQVLKAFTKDTSQDFYTVVGTDTYTGTAVAETATPGAYFNGQKVIGSFTTNTGAATIDASTLGVKGIVVNGAAAAAGEISGFTVLIFDSGNDRFEVLVSNVYTEAEKTKLAGIETNATADQNNAEIKSAYEANANTNEFSDAEQSKLAGIEANATAEVSATTTVEGIVELATQSQVNNGTAGVVVTADILDNLSFPSNLIQGRISGTLTRTTTLNMTSTEINTLVRITGSGGNVNLASVPTSANSGDMVLIHNDASGDITIIPAGGDVLKSKGVSGNQVVEPGGTITVVVNDLQEWIVLAHQSASLDATNGWLIDEDTGIITQWGTTGNLNNDSDAWVNSPTGFHLVFTTVYMINAAVTSLDATGAIGTDPWFAARISTTSTFQYRTNALTGTNQISWIAIGR